MNKLLFLAAVLLGIAGTANADSLTEQTCIEARKIISDAQSQMPMQVDFATTWMGASAFFAQGTCYISNEYLVDSDAIIDTAAAEMKRRGMSGTRQSVAEFYVSPDGRATLIADLKNGLKLKMAEALKVPSMQISFNYGTSDPIEPFTITLKSEAQL